jgi:diacylglycerol O-acyltransferase / wax synthase
MWFLTGLADGRVGLFVRMHRAIADGMAAVATIARFLDATPGRSSCRPARMDTGSPTRPCHIAIVSDNADR